MEWTVFEVLAAVAALFLSLGVPIIKLNGTITKLNVTLERTEKDVTQQKQELERQKDSARESHRRLWEHNDEQDDKLNDHERRITILEHKKGEIG